MFSGHKLEKFSSNHGKVHFEGLVHLLRYIRDSNNLGLIYYVKINDTPLSELLRQDRINTKKQFMVLSDSSWKDFTYTGRSTGEYIVFYQGGPIDHCTHVTGLVSQSSAESEYNAACNVGMALAHFMVPNNEFLHKDKDVVPEQAPITILDKNNLCPWLIMVRTPNTPSTFLEECNF